MLLLKLQSLWELFRLALAGNEKSFTSGNVNRATFLIAVPAMLELGLESVFILIDLIFVSRLGDQAVAIFGITNSVLILIQSIAIGLSIAATAVVSRRVGERKSKVAGLAAMQSIYLGIGIGLLCCVTTLMFNKEILRFSGASNELIWQGNDFSRLMFGGAGLMILRILINGIFRGSGNTQIALRVILFANLVNATLGAILIFGFWFIPALGLIGAALATVIGNFLAVSYQIFFLFTTNNRITIGKEQLILVPSIMKKQIRLAFSGTIQSLVPSFSRFIMISIVALLGEKTLAGYIIANRIILFTVLPSWGIANAAAVLTGQNLGAKQPDRAEESVWKTGLFNMCFLGSIAVLIWGYSDSMAGFFTNNQQVVNSASEYLQYMALAYFFFGFTMVIARSLNAAGAVNTVLCLNILMFVVIQIPLAYWLAISMNWGENGIYLAILVSEIVMSIACVSVFKIGKWKKVNV